MKYSLLISKPEDTSVIAFMPHCCVSSCHDLDLEGNVNTLPSTEWSDDDELETVLMEKERANLRAGASTPMFQNYNLSQNLRQHAASASTRVRTSLNSGKAKIPLLSKTTRQPDEWNILLSLQSQEIRRPERPDTGDAGRSSDSSQLGALALRCKIYRPTQRLTR